MPRALFAGIRLSDRQMKVLERIEGDLIIDVGATPAFSCRSQPPFQ